MQPIRNLASIACAACCLTGARAAALLSANPPGVAPLRRVQTIPLPGPAGRFDHLALDSVHHRLFVANMPNSSLDVVDLEKGKRIAQVPGQHGIQGIAYAPELNLIFVGNGSGDFNTFDGRNYRLLKSLHLHDDCDNVRYDPRTQRAYVIHAPRSLAVIDAKTGKLLKDIPLPGDPESFQLESKRPRIYLNTPSPSQVVVINTERMAVEKVYPLRNAGANFPMALDEAHHRLLVGCRRPPRLDVLDTETGQEVTSVPIPGDTDDLWYDAPERRIYVSCGEGDVAVLQQTSADRYEPMARLRTGRGARTSLYDPIARRLYLLVPRHAGSSGPEVWIFQVSGK
jgi:hypothetical protein